MAVRTTVVFSLEDVATTLFKFRDDNTEGRGSDELEKAWIISARILTPLPPLAMPTMLNNCNCLLYITVVSISFPPRTQVPDISSVLILTACNISHIPTATQCNIKFSLMNSKEVSFRQRKKCLSSSSTSDHTNDIQIDGVGFPCSNFNSLSSETV